MKKKLSTIMAGVALAVCAQAEPLIVCDFENYEVGTKIPMVYYWGGESASSTATVEMDPSGRSNKVLHVRLKDWNCCPQLALPTDLRGSALTDRYTMASCDFYRSASDANDWKQFVVYLGTQELFRTDGYPHQGDKGAWQTRTYGLGAASVDNKADYILMGIHSDDSDYYLDNVKLAGPFDSFVWLSDGEVVDLCVDNTDKAYTTIGSDYYLPEGVKAAVRGSRYSEWTGKLVGSGELDIYSGGERFYLGSKSSKGATYPDWSGMTGRVNIHPYTAVKDNCGFYGLIMNSGTFQPDNLDASNSNRMFAACGVTLHEGGRIAGESGTRGILMGQLDTEKGSVLDSYYKSGSAKTIYVIGALGTDSHLAGTIGAQSSGNQVGLIKEGVGSLVISGVDNNIAAGVRVLAGSVVIDNDLPSTSQKANGAIGSTGTLYLFGGTSIAGHGAVGKLTEAYGQVRPEGTLWFANCAGEASDAKLTLHPEAKVVCDIRSTADYSSIKVLGSLAYSNQTEWFEASDRTPRLVIELADGAALNVGDEITLVEASAIAGDWTFDMRYPKRYTWSVDQLRGDDGSFKVVAKVVSLDYSGQGDVEDDDDDFGGGNGGYGDDDWSAERDDSTPLRHYASVLKKSIGVAVASYRYDCSKDDGACGLVGKEFKLVVGENEMKFDATEPSQNNFNYGGSDAVMWVASRNDQEVRGHTLAWHQQVAQWVSSDGKKNDKGYTKRQLLDILKNHIFNVVGKYKGQIREWDVCNEVLDDDQSIVRSNPEGYTLRPSIWATYIGEEFIDSAFVWTRQADPQAKLYINDYGVEFAGDTKAEAYFNLVKRLQKSGVPIDGCGLQCHLTTGQLDTLKLERNVARYAPLGLNCIITELDISLANPSAANALDIQAKEYAAITRVFLRNDNCPSMLLWGISDNNSWRDNQPLIFDKNLEAKPAYYAIHAQLRRAAEVAQSGLQQVVTPEAGVMSVKWYDLCGREMDAPTGFVIERRIYDDGSVVTEKRIYR